MKVAVTGIGAVGAFGTGRASLEAVLALGAPAKTAAGRPAPDSRRGWSASPPLLAAAQDLSEWVPQPQARRMSAPSRMAVAAARQALHDAGLPRTGPDSEVPAGVVMSTSWGSAHYTERILDQIRREGPEFVSPFYFTECVANAAAAQVALSLGARGPNITVAQREAGVVLALARGAREIAAGRASVVLAGAADEMTPTLHMILARFGALSLSSDGVARPFDRGRDGLLAAEGATVVVLEPLEAARRRGARVLARVETWGCGFDPTAGPVSWGRETRLLGTRAARSLSSADGPLDAIVSGASGSPSGDRAEASFLQGLKAALGLPVLPPVLAPKGATGEYGGFHVGAAVAAAAGAPVAPPAGFSAPDAELGVEPHRGSLPRCPRRVLVSSCASGGAAAWAVLSGETA